MSMSLSSDVPLAIQAFIDARSAGDREALLAAFTEDALLTDGEQEFQGHDGIAGWAGAGAPRVMELLGVRQGDTQQEVVATVLDAAGTTDLEIVLRGDRIARLHLPA